jgi:hypothetical protein
MPFVVFAMMSFTFLFPLMIGAQMYRHRKHLRSPITRHRYGFLYANFSVGAEFWEFHELFRKLILTGLLVFVRNVTHRAALAILVCVVSVSTLNYFRPHLNSLVFAVEQVSFLLATFKYLAVILLDTNTALVEREGQSNDEVMGNLLIALDVAFMVGGALSLLVILFVMNSSIRSSMVVKHESMGGGGATTLRGQNGDTHGSGRVNGGSEHRKVFNSRFFSKLMHHSVVEKAEAEHDRSLVRRTQRIMRNQTFQHKRLEQRLQQRLTKRQSLASTAQIADRSLIVHTQGKKPKQTFQHKELEQRLQQQLTKRERGQSTMPAMKGKAAEVDVAAATSAPELQFQTKTKRATEDGVETP